MATSYNDTLNGAYIPPGGYSGYTGPTGGNWINWTINASTIQSIGPIGATGTTMTLSVPSGGVIQGTIGGTGAMLLTTSNVYIGQGAGWNNGNIIGYTGAAYGYGKFSLFGSTGATGSVGIGSNAAAYGQSSNAVAIGNSAGIYNQGPGSVAIGYYAAGYTGYSGGYTGGQGTNSIAIGYQAGYQNDNTTVITSINNVAIGCNSGYQNQQGNSIAIGTNTGLLNQPLNSISIGNGAGYQTDSYNYGSGISLSLVNRYNINSAVLSTDGQYIALCATNYIPCFSINYGGFFYALTSPQSIQSYGFSSTATTQYIIMSAGVSGTSFYYSMNGNAGGVGINSYVTFTAINGANQIPSTNNSGQYGAQPVAMSSSTGQYIIIGNNAISTIGQNLYYSSNGGASSLAPSNLTFTNIGTNTGLSGLLTTGGGSFQAAMSSTGQYILLPYSTSATSSGTMYLFYSTNGNSSPSQVSFTSLSPSCGIPQVRNANTALYFIRGASMSSNGQYMLVCQFGGNIYLSSNGGALSTPSTISFTNISGGTFNGVPNGLPSTSQNYAQTVISYSGQYMATFVYGSSTLYLSTNYGNNWVTNTSVITFCYSMGMSGDGSKIVICSIIGNDNGAFSYTLQQTAVANTVAIGYNAGYYNQGANSVCIGNNTSAPISIIGTGGAVVLNGTSAATSATASGFFVNPVRVNTVANSTGTINYSSAGELFCVQLPKRIYYFLNNTDNLSGVSWASGVAGDNFTITNPNSIITFSGRATCYRTTYAWVYIYLRLNLVGTTSYYYVTLCQMFVSGSGFYMALKMFASGPANNYMVIGTFCTPNVNDPNTSTYVSLPVGTYQTYIYSNTAVTDINCNLAVVATVN